MLVEMLKYTQLADARIIQVFEQNKGVPAKAISLFNHVLSAQHIWAYRILSKPSLYAVWEEHLPETFSSVSAGNFDLFKYILEHIDLTKEINYTNSKGEQFSNEVKDILFHAFNHSTYHRAQIASILKTVGIEPPVTDYIMLKRDNKL